MSPAGRRRIGERLREPECVSTRSRVEEAFRRAKARLRPVHKQRLSAPPLRVTWQPCRPSPKRDVLVERSGAFAPDASHASWPGCEPCLQVGQAVTAGRPARSHAARCRLSQPTQAPERGIDAVPPRARTVPAAHRGRYEAWSAAWLRAPSGHQSPRPNAPQDEAPNVDGSISGSIRSVRLPSSARPLRFSGHEGRPLRKAYPALFRVSSWRRAAASGCRNSTMPSDGC